MRKPLRRANTSEAATIGGHWRLRVLREELTVCRPDEREGGAAWA